MMYFYSLAYLWGSIWFAAFKVELEGDGNYYTQNSSVLVELEVYMCT